ncbi:MAG: hypothetical protein JW993_13975 [Sedimentisphaerales bacterium]|nr:hypothetical protein [Sedimentisphaerales bacterium]
MKQSMVCVLSILAVGCAPSSWRGQVTRQLPLLGHRNWVVIADSAYPWQTSPGIETIYTGADQIEVVASVLDAVRGAPHVRPIIYTDAELEFVPEENAPGISIYRDTLREVLGDADVQSLPHEQIIAKLDEAGKTFHVLLLKTDLTLPYTSVFLQLDCGYWTAQAEQQLRDAIRRGE